MNNEIIIWLFYIIAFILGLIVGINVIKKYARNPVKIFMEKGGIDLLISNKEEWNEWRKLKPSWNPNFSNVKLENLDLSSVNMSEVNFTKASLINVNLDKANLTSTIFNEAKLINVSLKGAILDRTIFSGAELNDIILDDSTVLSHIDFNSAKTFNKKQIQELTSLKGESVKKDYNYFKLSPDGLTNVNPQEFEIFIAELLMEKGFAIKNISRDFDNGYDFEGYMSNQGVDTSYCIEVKCYNSTNKVGLSIIERINAIRIASGFDKAMVVTNSHFTKSVEEYASKNPSIVLIDINKIKGWLDKK